MTVPWTVSIKYSMLKAAGLTERNTTFTMGPGLQRITGEIRVPHNTARSKPKHNTFVRRNILEASLISKIHTLWKGRKVGNYSCFRDTQCKQRQSPAPALQEMPHSWPTGTCAVHCSVSAVRSLPTRLDVLFAVTILKDC